MTKKAVVLLAEGFEEIEAASPIDVLRRAGCDVMVAGVGGKTIKGSHGLAYLADTELKESLGGYDLLVLPGGMPGAKHLGDSAIAREMAGAMIKSGKLVAAICAAPVMTLGAWGCLNGKTATCYPGMENMFPAEVEFSDKRVVIDGNIVTSRGPGTALEFSLALAGLMAGEGTANRLAEEMLLKA